MPQRYVLQWTNIHLLRGKKCKGNPDVVLKKYWCLHDTVYMYICCFTFFNIKTLQKSTLHIRFARSIFLSFHISTYEHLELVANMKRFFRCRRHCAFISWFIYILYEIMQYLGFIGLFAMLKYWNHAIINVLVVWLSLCYCVDIWC